MVMARPTEVQMGQAIAFLKQGQTKHKVGMQFGVDVPTKQRLVSCLRETGRPTDRPRTGRPRVTTIRKGTNIRLAHLRKCYMLLHFKLLKIQ